MALGRSFFLANPGSSSRKYAWFTEGKLRFSADFQVIGGKAVIRTLHGAGWQESTLDFTRLEDAAIMALEALAQSDKLKCLPGMDAWGVRLVAPGSVFQKHRMLDDEAMLALEKVHAFAPLHLGPALEEIRRLSPEFRSRPLFGLSDSAFHSTLPAVARIYAIPREEAARFDLYRFGYHGLSAQSIVRRALLPDGSKPRRLVVCHLGGGSSITAVRDGKSVDTSTGFSPMEGLVMATRPGDIDAGLVLHLAESLGLGPGEMQNHLQKRCGLLGISGRSADTRELLDLEGMGDVDASLALEAYAYRARKYIGAYVAALEGMDMIAFTGGIGEHSPEMRARICKGLACFGLVLDPEKNGMAHEGDLMLHADSSSVAIAAFKTGEMEEMALELERTATA